MADGAHLRVLLPKALRVEPRPVGVEAPAGNRRVAQQAIVFRVTRNARLEALTRRYAVPGEEESASIMVAALGEPSLGDEAGLHMTAHAEAPGVVAIATRRLARVGLCWVRLNEAVRVVAAWARGRVAPMAVEALATDVAGGAGSGRGGCRLAVASHEAGAMAQGNRASRLRARPSALSGGRKALGSLRHGEVAVLQLSRV